jgi:hypothetical protein
VSSLFPHDRIYRLIRNADGAALYTRYILKQEKKTAALASVTGYLAKGTQHTLEAYKAPDGWYLWT